MAELPKKISIAFLFLCIAALSTGFAGYVGAQERKPADVQMPSKPLPPDSLITMDFQDVDLSVLIKFMGELTGKNFIVGEQVRGKVTVISPRKITVREAYRVFESVLEMNGYSAVPADGSIKIVPAAVARQSGVEIYEGKEAGAVRPEDKMITQVIPLEYASADEVRNLLASSISKDGMIISYKPTNHLIITDRASNIHRLLRIIDQIDVRVAEEKIRVFPLEFASARSLAEKLNQLIASQQPGQPAAPGVARPPSGSPVPRLVRIVADERTNMLIVLANEDDTREIANLIGQLDKQAPRGKSQLHVVYLEHARAEDLAKVLNSIITGKARVAQRTAPQQQAIPGQVSTVPPVEEASITADKATNSVVITASPQEFQEI